MTSLVDEHNEKIYTRVIKNYDDTQQGQDIRDEDVVNARSVNVSGEPRYYVGRSYHELEQKFAVRSNAYAPTYGNCMSCYMSGPLNMICDCSREETGIHQTGYTIMYSKYGNPKPYMSETRIIDTEWLASIMGKGHKKAKAEREIKTTKTRKFRHLFSCFRGKKQDVQHDQ